MINDEQQLGRVAVPAGQLVGPVFELGLSLAGTTCCRQMITSTVWVCRRGGTQVETSNKCRKDARAQAVLRGPPPNIACRKRPHTGTHYFQHHSRTVELAVS